MKYLKKFEEISSEYIRKKVAPYHDYEENDDERAGTKGKQVDRLEDAAWEKDEEIKRNSPEEVSARETVEKRKATIATMEEEVRKNPYVKKLEESSFNIILNEDDEVDMRSVGAKLRFYEGKPVGFLLTNPKTKNEASLSVNEEGISCDLTELRDLCCPEYEDQSGYWGNYQEANQIAILGFDKYTLTNLKFILKQVFNVGNVQSVMMADRDGNYKKVYDEDTFGSGDSVYSEEKKIIKLGFPCEEFENVHWKGNN
jgi:hypothetical protein